MNYKLLDDEVFNGKINTRIENLGNICGSEMTGEWEEFKRAVKMDTIERSTTLKYEKEKEEKQLRSTLKELVLEECKSPGLFIDDINKIKSKLQLIDTEHYRGAIIRARAEKFLAGEALTKRALATEKRYARANEITEIDYHGTTTRDSSIIERAFLEFYESLLSHKAPKEEGFTNNFCPFCQR
ncbi:unnamed protein product [Ixodes pacificus]